MTAIWWTAGLKTGIKGSKPANSCEICYFSLSQYTLNEIVAQLLDGWSHMNSNFFINFSAPAKARASAHWGKKGHLNLYMQTKYNINFKVLHK